MAIMRERLDIGYWYDYLTQIPAKIGGGYSRPAKGFMI